MKKFSETKYSRSMLIEKKKKEFNDINIDELLDIHHNQLSSRVERWTNEGSGWTINSITHYQPGIFPGIFLQLVNGSKNSILS